MDNRKQQIVSALAEWIKQRPGLEYGNYGCPRSYRQELRGITRDLNDARKLLRNVEMSTMPAETIEEAFGRAFGGRMSWDGSKIDYCVGQYWPTEYRRAACAVLARALWQHHCSPEDTGHTMRAKFRRMFGRGISSRWFS